MDFYKLFYWLTRADSIRQSFDTFSNWFLFFTIIFTLAYILTFIFSKIQDNTISSEDREQAVHWRKHFGKLAAGSFLIMTILWIAWAATPDKKDALIILAGGTVGNFLTKDSSAKHIPSEVMLLLRNKIKEEISETSLKEVGSNGIDSLKNKSKEELLEIIKNKNK